MLTIKQIIKDMKKACVRTDVIKFIEALSQENEQLKEVNQKLDRQISIAINWGNNPEATKLLIEENEQLKADLAESQNHCTMLILELGQLKAQLERAIVPRFSVGQEVWLIVTNILNGEFVKLSYVSVWSVTQDILCKFHYEVVEVSVSRHLHVHEFQLFATEAEAQASLNQKEGES